MVKLTKIYTRGGDAGETSLVDGSRVKKYQVRIDAVGAIEEANAAIGLARLYTDGTLDEALGRIQNDLFDLGADIATPDLGGDAEANALRIIDAQTERLEYEIDRFNSELEPLDSFILPGGGNAAAHLHMARTIVRRAERLIVAAADEEALNPAALRYVNRLSDHLFVLARTANDGGRADILWQPGKTRQNP